MTGVLPPGRVVSTHSVIVDLRLAVPALPEVGGDVLASAAGYDVGGGFNLLSAAARQGVRVAYAGSYGAGPHGGMVEAAMRELGVRVLQRSTAAGDTGLCITLVDARAERSFVTVPGVESRVAPEQLARVGLTPGDVVAVSGYDLVYEGAGDALVGWLRSGRDQVVLLDPGPLVLDIPVPRWVDVLSAVTVLTVNQREARLLAAGDELDARALHRSIRRQHPVRSDAWLVVRYGSAGCTVDGGPHRAPFATVPSMPVRPVDSTGAGDTHAGVLLAELVRGRDVHTALRRANVAAAMSVTLPGPATAPTRRQLDEAAAWSAGAAVDAVWAPPTAHDAAGPHG